MAEAAATERFVYRLAFAKEWEATEKAGLYAGAELDATDGYLHLSTQAQCQETARLYFKGAAGLQMWTIDLNKVPAKTSVHPEAAVAAASEAGGDREVRWEPSPVRPEDPHFPHVYGGGGVPIAAIVRRSDLALGEDTIPTFPEGA
eukprot:CAMPEP_0197610054 /NCGR_PEP_ID=MMETSP1326-20131121/52501_1 /TAXON_ID=1155430 /ORGANISM="Genus nov. species nov., Strain RCC2288" /LENGTH=145 /DNA_ID=CAMNT_0043178513 /DNA_START=84 /DNA_END=518 /DNA_ORIENTATION=+